MKMFEGIFCVMLTAYDERGGIDRESMAAMARHLVDSGVHGLVVLGSNGECPYLTRDLRRDAVEAVVGACGGSVPVIAGVNERGTEQALEAALDAEQAGADGILLALSQFYTLDEKAVFGYYESLAGGSGLPILYYNYPSATGIAMEPGQIARIARIDSVVGAKETIFDIEEVRSLVEAADADFCVFSGMTLNLKAAMEAGACGAICPLPNIIPETAVRLYEAMSVGASEEAGALQNEVLALAPLLAGSPTPHAMMKEAMRLLGHRISTAVKGPLPGLSAEQSEAVRTTLAANGLVQG